jgi:hypothetical protein
MRDCRAQANQLNSRLLFRGDKPRKEPVPVLTGLHITMINLGSFRPYLEQLERVHRKYLEKGKLVTATQGGLPFSRISMRRKSFAKAIAKEVAADTYEFKPVEKRKIPKPGKPGKFRTIYLLEISDLIVHGVLADILTKWVEELLPECTFSYRDTKTWWDGVNSFAKYLRAHHASRKNPKERGLYVLRADVKEYFASIPVDAHSLLWPMLRELIAVHIKDPEAARQFSSLLCRALRPVVREPDGALYCETVGIPTGSPLSPSTSNLYLNALDCALSNVPGGYYGRYGDDFLFAHPDYATAIEAEREIERHIARLGLTFNADKAKRVYFTGAGIPSPADPQFTGRSSVTFLGCDISFKAEITIQSKAINGFLKTIRRRVRKMERLLREYELEEKGMQLCVTVNRLLNPESPFRHPFMDFLLSGVTSRSDLKNVDYTVALIVAEALSGARGAKAFRSVPYKKLRSEWGLVSLVARRNAH